MTSFTSHRVGSLPGVPGVGWHGGALRLEKWVTELSRAPSVTMVTEADSGTSVCSWLDLLRSRQDGFPHCLLLLLPSGPLQLVSVWNLSPAFYCNLLSFAWPRLCCRARARESEFSRGAALPASASLGMCRVKARLCNGEVSPLCAG